MTGPEILLVEDDPDDLEVILAALGDAGVSAVRVVRDGEQALRELADGLVPRMMLLDLSLPKLGGHDVLRATKADARTRRIPVVVLTTSRADADVERAYDLCAASYILKPADYGRFAEIIKEVTHYWLFVNHPARAAVAES